MKQHVQILYQFHQSCQMLQLLFSPADITIRPTPWHWQLTTNRAYPLACDWVLLLPGNLWANVVTFLTYQLYSFHFVKMNVPGSSETIGSYWCWFKVLWMQWQIMILIWFMELMANFNRFGKRHYWISWRFVVCWWEAVSCPYVNLLAYNSYVEHLKIRRLRKSVRASRYQFLF